MGYTTEQLSTASTIIRVGRAHGLSRRACSQGIACAMVESNLRNLHYGDRDSLGAFQQRGVWGSAANRLDVAWSATAFFVGSHYNGGWYPGLTSYPGWSGLNFGAAIQQVQRSGFPLRYGLQYLFANRLCSSLLPGGSFPKPLRGNAYAMGGDLGAAVAKIQRYVGAVDDGDFGPHTDALVRVWQRAAHLTPDGAVGPVTWKAMS